MRTVFLAALLTALTGTAIAEDGKATLRGGPALDESISAPPIAKTVNRDLRRVRNYPEQPPIIPHKIDGYQIDLNVNQCMTCHSRKAIEVSQAPMVSVTHFMDREGQFLATISPRRYFCTQCHVPATEARPLVENSFVDVDDVIDFLQRNGSD